MGSGGEGVWQSADRARAHFRPTRRYGNPRHVARRNAQTGHQIPPFAPLLPPRPGSPCFLPVQDYSQFMGMAMCGCRRRTVFSFCNSSTCQAGATAVADPNGRWTEVGSIAALAIAVKLTTWLARLWSGGSRPSAEITGRHLSCYGRFRGR
jgi:hypothetical protein